MDAADGDAILNLCALTVLILGSGRECFAASLPDLDPDGAELRNDRFPAAIQAQALPPGAPDTERRCLRQDDLIR
jgi:hypothetical protein